MEFKAVSCVFPTEDILSTVNYYEKVLGFWSVHFLDSVQPHIRLYRDAVEILLTVSQEGPVKPNHELYGYGWDAFIHTDDVEGLYGELKERGAAIIAEPVQTGEGETEFVIEDCDGRWLAFGNR